SGTGFPQTNASSPFGSSGTNTITLSPSPAGLLVFANVTIPNQISLPGPGFSQIQVASVPQFTGTISGGGGLQITSIGTDTNVFITGNNNYSGGTTFTINPTFNSITV